MTFRSSKGTSLRERFQFDLVESAVDLGMSTYNWLARAAAWCMPNFRSYRRHCLIVGTTVALSLSASISPTLSLIGTEPSPDYSGFMMTPQQAFKCGPPSCGFNFVGGGWNVPTVSYVAYAGFSPQADIMSAWIGIGGGYGILGNGDKSLIQIGTYAFVAAPSGAQSQLNCPGGSTNTTINALGTCYVAFFETLGGGNDSSGACYLGNPNASNDPDFCAFYDKGCVKFPVGTKVQTVPCIVMPNDQLYATIQLDTVNNNPSPEYFLTINDYTQNWVWSPTNNGNNGEVEFTASGLSVDWIVEAPFNPGTAAGIASLAGYSPQVTFTNANIDGQSFPISISQNGVELYAGYTSSGAKQPFGGLSTPCAATNGSNGSGSSATLVVNYGNPNKSPCSPVFFSTVNTHSLPGNGFGSIVWADTSGDVAAWLMNGGTISNPTASYVATVSPSTWSISGQRDFNGDGYADLLWHDTSGDVAIWEMNGTTILNPTATYVATVSPSTWTIVETGDFNGDGMSDILWYDTSGDTAIWEMNGTTILNPTTSYVATVPTAWSIQGTGAD